MSDHSKKPAGRRTKTHPLSISPEVLEWVEGRVEQYSPVVKGVSHYFQLLVELDKRQGLLKRLDPNELLGPKTESVPAESSVPAAPLQ
jgi:hypothetical protein